MDRPKIDFSIDDLLAEIQAEAIPDGVTIADLCARAGLPNTSANMNRVGNRIKDLVAVGTWEFTGKGERPNVCGEMRRIPLYRPKRQEE